MKFQHFCHKKTAQLELKVTVKKNKGTDRIHKFNKVK